MELVEVGAHRVVEVVLALVEEDEHALEVANELSTLTVVARNEVHRELLEERIAGTEVKCVDHECQVSIVQVELLELIELRVLAVLQVLLVELVQVGELVFEEGVVIFRVGHHRLKLIYHLVHLT